MRIGIIAPTAIEIPVRSYGGIEVAAQWMATEMTRRGHEVTLFANTTEGPSGQWKGVHLLTETDVFNPAHHGLLRVQDAVLDFSHEKYARFARLRNYLAIVMWTDKRDESGRNVYPSEAVREAFHDRGGFVVPLGIPLDGVGITTGDDLYVTLGRVAQYKGQDLAVKVALHNHVPLMVAGHVGAYGDTYFAQVVAKQCRDNPPLSFVANPPELNTYLDHASGLLHLHRWIESFSIVAAQALIRGVPILTTDVGAVQEWVRHTDGGLVVSLKDLEAGRLDITENFFQTKWVGHREGIIRRARKLFDVQQVAETYERLMSVKP